MPNRLNDTADIIVYHIDTEHILNINLIVQVINMTLLILSSCQMHCIALSCNRLFLSCS